MSIISPEFTFAQYWSYEIRKDGGQGPPFPPDERALLNASLDGKFVYAFGEVAGAATPFQLVEIFFVRQPAGALFPSIHTVPQQSTTDVTEKEMSPAVDMVALPTTSSGGVQDRKYFFLAVPRLLTAGTISELESERPAELPLVRMTPAGRHFRFLKSSGDGLTYTESAQEGRRALFVIDPYSAIRHIADVHEFRCDAAVRFVKPEAAETEAERRVVEERLLRHALALEIDALEKTGMDFNAELGSKANMRQLLRDMDPTVSSGRLATLRRQREDAAMAIVLLTNHGRLWELLERDARATDDRAKKHYGAHLDATAYAHRRIAESKTGVDFWSELSRKFPMKDSGQQRGLATSAMEFTAQHFVFAEKLDPQPDFKEPILHEAARNLLALHTQMASVFASQVKDKLDDLTGLFKADAEFESWASGPLRTQMGLLAYRWAYHIRSVWFIDRLELNGEPVFVGWNEAGSRMKTTVLNLTINLDTGEFGAKFPVGSEFLGHVGRAMNAAVLVFSLGSLGEALQKKQDPTVPLLKSSSALVSLLSDPYFVQKLTSADAIAEGTKGAKALKLLGVAGSLFGTVASGLEAREAWQNDRDGDLIVAHGVNLLGGVLATWGATAMALGSTGPVGWIALGGLTLSLLGPLMIAYVTDTPVENMVEHSVFGTKPGANDKAPGLAVCEAGRFTAWASSGVPALEEQIRAFQNVTWMFAIAGAANVGPYPVLRFFPQRLLPGSGFNVQVRIHWAAPGTTGEVERGSVFLHVGEKHRLRVEALSGKAFGGRPLSNGRALLTRGRLNGRLFFDWVIAPESAGEREFLEKNGGRPVEAVVTVSLSAHGKDDDRLVVPLTAKGDPARVLTYRLVRVIGPGLPLMETEEKLSDSVYT